MEEELQLGVKFLLFCYVCGRKERETERETKRETEREIERETEREREWERGSAVRKKGEREEESSYV